MPSTRDSDPSGRGSTNEGRRDFKFLISFLSFLGFVLAVEGLAQILWSYSVDGSSVGNEGKPLSGWGVWATWLICSGAASLVGGLFGFLFGIPRSINAGSGRIRPGPTVQTPSEAITSAIPSSSTPATNFPPAAAPRLLRVNTNLEDISDFVTKALFGAGLAQANGLVEGAGRLADFLGPSFGPGRAGQVVAIATIAYGGLGGFFAGYLATRLYLTAAFERHDPQGLPPA
jgi:hypothetical protein